MRRRGWDHRRWLFARWKLAQQIPGQMGDTGDGVLEGLLGVRGGLLHPAHLPHVLAGRSFDLVICGLRLEAAQGCDIATHRQRVGRLGAPEATTPHCFAPLGSDHQDGAHLAGVFVVTEGGGGGALPRTTPVKRAVPSRILAYLLASLIAAAGIAVAIWLEDVTGTTLFMSMLLSVVVSVWLFGPGPGVVTLLITGAACPVVIEPGGGYLQLTPNSWLLIGADTCSSGRWWSRSAGVWRGRGEGSPGP